MDEGLVLRLLCGNKVFGSSSLDLDLNPSKTFFTWIWLFLIKRSSHKKSCRAWLEWAIDGTFFFEQPIWHDRPEDTHAKAFKHGGSVAGFDEYSTKTPRRSQRALTKGV